MERLVVQSDEPRRPADQSDQSEKCDQHGSQQQLLPEHDRQLVAGAALDVATARRRLRGAEQPRELRDAASGERPADYERGAEQDRGDGRGYVPLTFRISAEIAGTTSCRSPITP